MKLGVKMPTMKRTLYLCAGTFCFVLGIIGIIVPVLPTTPLLLLATYCYSKSSEKMYAWLLNNRFFGAYIKQYRNGQGIPLKAKITAITLLWLTLPLSILFIIPIIIVKLLLTGLLLYVTWFIASRKTQKAEKKESLV